jgi:3-hydroxybutyryl-CoA dehydrogenase
MHFMNPVPVMRLVEIIKGHQTSKNTVETIISLTEQIEKVPLVAADYPGFVANRILLPMINEAIEALFQGVAEVEAIDEMMKLGMGHPMGPLRLADFIGLDVCLSVLEVLHQGFGKDKYAPCPLLRNLVAAGNLGVKTKRGFYDYSDNPKQPIPLQF